MSRAAPGRTRGLVPCLVAVAVATGAASRAQEDLVEPVHISYSSSPGCPSLEGFLAEVQARTARLRQVPAGERARSFAVVVQQQQGSARGTVTIRELDGTESVRELESPSCGEVASALALITAVAIDPRAKSGPLPAVSSSSAPTASSSAAPPPVVPPSATPAPKPWTLPVGAPRRSLWHLRAGADLGVIGGVLPDPAVAYGGGFELIGPSWALGSWSMRLLLLHASSGEISSEGGTATFGWTALRLTGCPARWPSGSTWGFKPCAHAEGGVLSGAGKNTVLPEEHQLRWWAFGGSLIAEWEMRWRIVLAVEGGIQVPWKQHQFHFDPGLVVYKVPGAGGFGLLSVAWRFL